MNKEFENWLREFRETRCKSKREQLLLGDIIRKYEEMSGNEEQSACTE